MFTCHNGSGSCGFIDLIEKQFLCAFNVNNIDWNSIIGHLSGLSYPECIEHQDLLLSATVSSPIVSKYPIKSSYERAFLKKLLTEVEKYDIAHPAIYDLYVKVLSKPEKVGDHYRHFLLSPYKIITIKESDSIISKGTTGLAVWQGGIALTEWALQNGRLLQGKNVLELGCGVGFTGIALCLSDISPTSYVFSDCHPDVLDTLGVNLRINGVDGNVSQLNESKIKVAPLDWGEVNQFSLDSSYQPDVVLAADVVYDQTLFDPLCKALNHFLSTKDTFAVLACTVRSEDTLEEFLKRLTNAGLIPVREKEPLAKTFVFLNTSPIHIYIIKSAKHGC